MSGSPSPSRRGGSEVQIVGRFVRARGPKDERLAEAEALAALIERGLRSDDADVRAAAEACAVAAEGRGGVFDALGVTIEELGFTRRPAPEPAGPILTDRARKAWAVSDRPLRPRA